MYKYQIFQLILMTIIIINIETAPAKRGCWSGQAKGLEIYFEVCLFFGN